MYAGAPLSLGAFRRRLPNADRPYVLPAAEILAPLGFSISGLIILWSGWDTDWKLGIAILIGYAILAANLIFNLNDKPVHLNLRGAAWLPVYLVGMGVITYVSSFGPLSDPLLGDYLGIIVTVVFSCGHLLLGDGRRAADRGDRGDGPRGRPARGRGPGDALALIDSTTLLAPVLGRGQWHFRPSAQRRVAMMTAASLATITSTAVNRGSVSQPSRSTSTRP